jgi:hypothetical protein
MELSQGPIVPEPALLRDVASGGKQKEEEHTLDNLQT